MHQSMSSLPSVQRKSCSIARASGFAIGVVIFVLKLPDGQVLFFGEIQITEGLQSILLIKKGLGAS